jgi:hypothetical protein
MGSSTWKYLVIGATAFGVLGLAGVELTSHARGYNVSQQSSRSERPAAFETKPIVASVASISSYGLDQARTSDW